MAININYLCKKLSTAEGSPIKEAVT